MAQSATPTVAGRTCWRADSRRRRNSPGGLQGAFDRGPTPEAAVLRFVEAAAAHDSAEVERLARWGSSPGTLEDAYHSVPSGVEPKDVTAEMPFGKNIAFVDVRGVSQGQPWGGRFVANKVGRRWFVSVGRNPNPGPPKPMSAR